MARILVVEDEPAIKNLFETILSGQGHAVITASDGREGIMRMLDVNGGINLIVTDQDMPGTSGVEMLRALKHIFGKTFPVLMVSGQAVQEKIDDLLLFLSSEEMGERAELLLKPIKLDQFLAAVGRMLA